MVYYIWDCYLLLFIKKYQNSMKTERIKSLILFGSTAKKQNDSSSDIDLCAIINDNFDESEITKNEILTVLGKNNDLKDIDSFSVYKESSLNKMLDYGSLFLWHLKLEGKILYGDDYFNKTFSKLKSFKNHLSEINYIINIYNKMEDSQNKIGFIDSFDISIYFTLIRNASIIACHKVGQPRFGRLDSFLVTKEIISEIPLNIEIFEEMMKIKLQYERGIEYNNKNLIYTQSLKSTILVTLLKIKEFVERND
ncbi:nucleotidyltransferase domain-containing protein [Arcicella sp. DC2W]|uniref:Nucleotidyltransferase domain-containing protein n=1 Tax=Arcicella gelida TaxID=2984195 RepID=A0ABU5SBU5_9BACT|nr:nucleotidyltransferase domain-containing protein [Arcicella sp. DC2W]MEA5405966.1 nucleotidyltransferase domain-containing protein [Arcicella sp. DC2W]